MSEFVRTVPWARGTQAAEGLLEREWLVANGLGGFSSETVAGVPTRRYHGLLVAALPAPLGRIVMVSDLLEEARLPDGASFDLGGEERAGQGAALPVAGHLAQFRTEMGLPVWRYEVADHVIEKRIVMPHLQNTVYVSYRLVGGEGPVWLRLRPALHFRPLEAPVSEPLRRPYTVTATEERYEFLAGGGVYPPVRMTLVGERPSFTVAREDISRVYYRTEAGRGYDAVGDLWAPGSFSADLTAEHPVVGLVASTESWETLGALDPEAAWTAELHRRRNLLADAHPSARGGMAGELVLAADQFVIAPVGRVQDVARAHALGDEVRSVIAGYHWFTDWGRDTMISLEGLTLATGRHVEAGYILRTFALHVRDGLIPNMFPDGETEGLYHTADATLWFFHALARYVEVTGDRATLRLVLRRLREVVDHHLRGTRFGIGVDPDDGLLRQGAEGYQLTWMDAKVDDWVVTPRRGKAVEINALWYNALCLLEGWLREEGEPAERAEAERLASYAARVRRSFDERFWYAEGGYLYDLVDGEGVLEDPACRPNQLFAVSLDHPVLDERRWRAVVDTVRERLLTPYGLRSLAPGHPDYKPVYFGDLRARDAAYHQGTVWAWLIGPFVDAWLKVYPGDRAGARELLAGFEEHLSAAGIGQISEIFDAEAPYVPRGCIAQAWSVAEVLRAWVRTAE